MKNSFVVAANWKMYKGPQETAEFFESFKKLSQKANQKETLLFFPPATCLSQIREDIGEKNWSWGPQNIFFEDEGAYTGEISPQVAAQLGARYALVGHSERRKVFGETDDWVAKKIQACQKHRMTPILCVGESLAERKNEQTLEILSEQLTQGLTLVDADRPLMVAYEPVWAIGTGIVAEPEQIQGAHEFIAKKLLEIAPVDYDISILYGGSVKPSNAAELSQIDSVGGFLVGSASLEPESFWQIVEASRK